MNAPVKDGGPPGLLLVEDTPSIQMLYRTVLNKAGYPPFCASSGTEALEKFSEHRPGIVLLDLMLPDLDGLVVMTQMLAAAPETRVIVITANGSVNKAVEATRKGAYDFLVKPLGDVRLVGAVASAVADSRAAEKQAIAANGQTREVATANFVALSDQMQAVRTVIEAVARSKAPVFIHGASGTGKRTAAEAIHKLSPRARRPIVSFKCSSLEGYALEAALFGTGPLVTPEQSEQGHCAIQKAEGGSILLRSPEALAAEHQARLLAMINSATLPLSPTRSLPVDVRILCTSSRDPHDAMRSGLLSEELFYRLFVFPLSLPPLHARHADIPVLAEQFLPEIALQEGKHFTTITPEAKNLLQRHTWDGNLHELRNVLRQAIVMNNGPELTASMLPIALVEQAAPGSDATPGAQDVQTALAGMTLAQIEERAIRAAIERHHGSIPRAALELDIAPSTIYRKRDGWTDPVS